MHNVRDYAVITASYWAFTLTDGALRMLVLLYLYEQGYTPIAIASLFLFYEFFGIVTNFVGGWLGARFGLKMTLFFGLLLQIVACSMLAAPAALLTIPYVMAAQGLSGVAKDLTKMSSKSYIKLVVPEHDQHGLMKWVSLLTGSKNTLKGAGFFLGGLLLALVGFRAACLGMAAGLTLALIMSIILLPGAAGKAKSKVALHAVLQANSRVRWLSAARFFLFGSRDIWFVLALPLYLASTLSWSQPAVGAFLALWIIGYGIVQAIAPLYVGGKRGQTPLTGSSPPSAARLAGWTAALVLPLSGILAALWLDAPPTATIIIGLAIFGVVFATNSAIHSYLIIAYAEGDRVSLNVGFYYMANAAGRLAGTVLSGAVFQAFGLGEPGLFACIAGSLVFVVLSLLLLRPLHDAERHASQISCRSGRSQVPESG